MPPVITAGVVPVFLPLGCQTITHMPQTVDELEQTQGVTHFCLSYTTISDEEAYRVAECVKRSTALEYLTIPRTVISANAVGILMKALAASKSVKTWGLGHIGLDDEGVNHISDALAINRSITELLLIGNSITDAGGRRLLDAISANITVKWIRLVDNMLSPKIVEDIEAVIARNRDIVHVHPFQTSPPYTASRCTIACHDLSRSQLNEVISSATAATSMYIYGTKF
jgi:Ran GTPase-activating protein (RanGAP) involved in mRNA processing and transport